jgi:hypothetical protein
MHRAVGLSMQAVLPMFVLACAAGNTEDSKEPDEIRIATDEQVFPADTLTDWVSYVEQLSEVKVISESAVPEEESEEPGRGYLTRVLLLQVQETLWTGRGVEPEDQLIAMYWLGWAQRGENRVPLISANAPRIEPGGKYILPLLRVHGDWGVLTRGSVLALPGDDVAEKDIEEHGQNSVARDLSEMSHDEIIAAFESTAPHPVAAQNWELPPFERFQRVQGR